LRNERPRYGDADLRDFGALALFFGGLVIVLVGAAINVSLDCDAVVCGSRPLDVLGGVIQVLGLSCAFGLAPLSLVVTPLIVARRWKPQPSDEPSAR